jgi:hypothetical protein
MNRLKFIQNLIGFAGLAAVPADWIKQYDKFYLLQCFCRGFKFYKGPNILPNIKEGDMLGLKREPENKHDPFAIAVYWKE